MDAATARRLAGAKAFLLDMDGVLYRGERAIPGAAEALIALRRRGRVLMVTNNSTKERAPLSATLRGMGIDVAPDEILIVTEVAERWLRIKHEGARLLVLGEDHFRAQLGRAGFTVVDQRAWREAQFVVCACRLTMDHDLLGAALNALIAGAAFVATNPDLVVDGDDGLRLEAGAYARLLEKLSGREPAVIGKPERPCFDVALNRLGVAADQAVMIGDNPETDVAGGRRNGLVAVHVLSGVTRRPAGDADAVAEDLTDFVRQLERASAT
jgi:4-nitrophenyl phosphatase